MLDKLTALENLLAIFGLKLERPVNMIPFTPIGDGEIIYWSGGTGDTTLRMHRHYKVTGRQSQMREFDLAHPESFVQIIEAIFGRPLTEEEKGKL